MNLEFNIETTSNDNYLKSHKIKSEITNNNSLLNSFLSIKGNNKDLYIEAKVEAYEDLTKENLVININIYYRVLNYQKILIII